ncbi:hypothetical protein FNJ84_06475 [Paracoccus sp. M683]|uniref:hypothetical protein n=1 Tax=Paracoccus sp. M683 TaxID=2594268 RepID=UPI00117D366D|nr:hypothetical protein [Paracoccus sp. M683]TRW98415.1 hypothetical protein FNJ84_06475 [Paracoccus sp. M683]
MLAYTKLWARYLNTHVRGFPGAEQIAQGDTLARVMAIYMWNGSVSHGGDHWSFSNQITAVEKCLRIRRKPPVTRDGRPVDNGTDPIFSPNDMQRAALCQYMFFQAWAIEPNLADTKYALPIPGLLQAAAAFSDALKKINDELLKFLPCSGSPIDPTAVTDCQPLEPVGIPVGSAIPYVRTIPQSIQY